MTQKDEESDDEEKIKRHDAWIDYFVTIFKTFNEAEEGEFRN